MRRPCLLDLDVTDAGLVFAFADRSAGMETGDAGVSAESRSGGNLDLHIDGFGATAERVATPTLSVP